MKLKYILEFAVFTCGAVVMVFELVGSRVIGPFLGTSLFVWTSLIGIILASLSLGYYLGGKQADKNASMSRLARIILLAAICIAITIGIKDILLLFLQKNVGDQIWFRIRDPEAFVLANWSEFLPHPIDYVLHEAKPICIYIYIYIYIWQNASATVNNIGLGL